MADFQLLSKLGEGSFATVYKARLRGSGALVAVKELRERGLSFERLVALPEVAALRAAGRHANLVQLQAASLVPVPAARGGARALLVMDLCEQGSLLDALERRASGSAGGAVSEPEARGVMRDLLAALAHLHGDGVRAAPPLAHRDVKPENVLVGAAPAGAVRELVCKLCDFGQAAPLGARRPLTAYVGTRWYRAPELLFGAPAYSTAVDVWAAGCVMAELFLLRPLFPGSSDADQLFRIASVLGSHDLVPPPGAGAAAQQLRSALPQLRAVGLAALLPNAGADAVEAIAAMLTPDARRRPRAQDVLRLPFFRAGLPEASLRVGSGGGSGAQARRPAAEEAVARALAEEAQASLERDIAVAEDEAEAEAEAEEMAGKEVSGPGGGNSEHSPAAAAAVPPAAEAGAGWERPASAVQERKAGDAKDTSIRTKASSESKESLETAPTAASVAHPVGPTPGADSLKVFPSARGSTSAEHAFLSLAANEPIATASQSVGAVSRRRAVALDPFAAAAELTSTAGLAMPSARPEPPTQYLPLASELPPFVASSVSVGLGIIASGSRARRPVGSFFSNDVKRDDSEGYKPSSRV